MVYQTAIKYAICATFALLLVKFFGDRKKSQEPYGTFHLGLNILPGSDPKDVPKTEWLNMGYWKVRFLEDYEIHECRSVDAFHRIPGYFLRLAKVCLS